MSWKSTFSGPGRPFSLSLVLRPRSSARARRRASEASAASQSCSRRLTVFSAIGPAFPHTCRPLANTLEISPLTVSAKSGSARKREEYEKYPMLMAHRHSPTGRGESSQAMRNPKSGADQEAAAGLGPFYQASGTPLKSWTFLRLALSQSACRSQSSRCFSGRPWPSVYRASTVAREPQPRTVHCAEYPHASN